MMGNILKTFKSKDEGFAGMDSDIIADYCWIFGDLNFRLNSDFKTLIQKIDELPSLVESLD